MCAYRHVGVDIEIPNNYVMNQDGTVLLQELRKHTDVVDRLELGSIIVINIGREPKHMALYLGDNIMIHSYEGAGEVVSHEMTSAWHNRIHSINRVKDNVLSIA
jgi:cell wall-associated NlpC family hydrolase